jgi:hypothetical protein
MRRSVLTIFLFFYTATVVALTVTRTEEWAAERAGTVKQHRSDRGAGLAGPHKHAPHQVQIKLHEDGSAPISSTVASSDPPYCESRLQCLLDGFVSHIKNHSVSSRAPPSSL